MLCSGKWNHEELHRHRPGYYEQCDLLLRGDEARIWKSPEQNDVTPSAIYIDRRGNKYVGKRAYESAPHSPDNAAMLFKRLMGTSTPITLSAVDITMTPEECSFPGATPKCNAGHFRSGRAARVLKTAR